MTKTLPLVVRCLLLYVLGCLLMPLSLTAIVPNMTPTSYIPADTLIFSIDDCTDEISICLDSLPLIDAANLSVLVNGEPYQKTIAGCNFDTISAYTYSTLFGQGASGPYELTIWRVGDAIFTGTFENIPDLVDSMNLWDPLGNWELDESAQLIAGGNGGTSYSNMAVNVISINTPSFIGYNFGMEAKGTELTFGAGIHRISIFDTLNNTLRNAVVAISCVGTRIVKGRVRPDETENHCLDVSRLMSTPEVIEFCGVLTEENVAYEIVNNDSCVDYTGRQIGFDTACVVVCDAFAFCDTTLLIVETYDVSHYREATVNMKVGGRQSYCLDTTVLVAPITQFKNDCLADNGTIANVTLDELSFCATIEGTIVGQDTSCLILCNQFGKCDTTILYINVHPAPTIETINLTLVEGDSMEICPEMAELSEIVTGIDDFCENNIGETIIFDINNVDLCFSITALNIGKDSICAVICDNFLICDTTYYIISVVSNAPSLTATPDLDTTSVNSPIIINVLGNDSIPNGMITDMEILSINGEPTNGTATTNLDGSVMYLPNQDFCADSDQFQYYICNATGCDTASVTIYVECAMDPPSGMKIYNGFSPNGDGQNDYFKIEGLAQFPNNELSVFNRWGTKVFQMKGYKSAWDGSWNNKALPDGTYFYVLKDGEGKEYSGAVSIRR